jgi:hypothetical protein
MKCNKGIKAAHRKVINLRQVVVVKGKVRESFVSASGVKEQERQASSILYTRHKDIVHDGPGQRLEIRRARPVRHPDGKHSIRMT